MGLMTYAYLIAYDAFNWMILVAIGWVILMACVLSWAKDRQDVAREAARSPQRSYPITYYPLPGKIGIWYYWHGKAVPGTEPNRVYPADVLRPGGAGNAEEFEFDFRQGWAFYLPEKKTSWGTRHAFHFDPRKLDLLYCRAAEAYCEDPSRPDPSAPYGNSLLYAEPKTRKAFLETIPSVVPGPPKPLVVELPEPQYPQYQPQYQPQHPEPYYQRPRNPLPITTAIIAASVAYNAHERRRSAERDLNQVRMDIARQESQRREQERMAQERLTMERVQRSVDELNSRYPKPFQNPRW